MLVIGERGSKSMSRRIKYTDEPLGKVRIIKDFLPPPEALVFKTKTVKVTMALSKPSIEFFKKQAKIHHTHYQTMIKNLLDAYTGCYKPKYVQHSKTND